jgi:hypothetical protein
MKKDREKETVDFAHSKEDVMQKMLRLGLELGFRIGLGLGLKSPRHHYKR